jgi:hypothetical protein
VKPSVLRGEAPNVVCEAGTNARVLATNKIQRRDTSLFIFMYLMQEKG